MSIDGRKEFKNAFLVASDTFKKGTISRLRRTTKLNFSKIPTNSAESESDLKKKINSFALENTIDVPDKKKYMVGARFRACSTPLKQFILVFVLLALSTSIGQQSM